MTESASKRILVLTASFGGGHTAMGRALEEYLHAHHSDTVSVETIDLLEEFAPSLNVLAKFAYQQSEEFFPIFSGTWGELAEESPGNPAVAEAKMMVLPRFQAHVDETRPDAILSTYSFAGGLATHVAGKAITALTVIASYDGRQEWLHPDTDVYFAAGRTVREQLTVAGLPWERIVESGMPVREQFAEQVSTAAARAELGLSDRFTVLLRADHGKPLEVLDVARSLLEEGVQVAALTSGNERIRERLAREAEDVPMLAVIDRVQAMRTLMAACDVLVCRSGGLMIPEACASSLPTILVPPVPAAEGRNIDFLVNYGAALLARDADDVVDKVSFLTTHERRMEQMGESASLVGKGQAAQTICERTLATLR